MSSVKANQPYSLQQSGSFTPLLFQGEGMGGRCTFSFLQKSRVGGRVNFLLLLLFHFPVFAFAQDSQNIKNGIAKMNEGNYDVAIMEFSKASEINPKNADAWYYMGEVYFLQKEDKKAMENYTKSIDLDTLNAKAYKGRGKLKARLEDYHGSIDDFTTAVKIDKLYSDAYFNRASSYLLLKNYKASIEDYSRVIQINKKDFQAYEQRGTARFQSGDTQGACKDWSKAGELGDMKIYEIIKKNCK